ncbi:MAG: hypothetical protein RG740_04435 [Acholeplasmataceae bacterium]|nr:hypothetical protein [Acholeplasmataceae bacterium]
MGAWGTKLYQDDVAQDVRDEYKKLLKTGLSNEEATQKLINDNKWLIDDMDDGPIFWFALADTQWKLGRLLPEVKDKAIQYIQDGEHVKTWFDQDPKLGLKRKTALDELMIQLNTLMPEAKKISLYKYFRNDWNIGDTYAYQLNGEYAKENGLEGRYIIIHKIDDFELIKGIDKDVFPIVYLKLTPDNDIPKNFNKIEACEYIRMNINRGKKMFEYRTFVWETSNRFFSKLTYLGNYTMTPPPDEFIQTHAGVPSVTFSYKHFDRLIVKDYLSLKDYQFK